MTVTDHVVDRSIGEILPTEVTLEELTRLALEADPDGPIPPDAVPLGLDTDGPLPSWYMPPARRRVTGRRGIVVAAIVIAALLMIVASGLCVTYGQLTIA